MKFAGICPKCRAPQSWEGRTADDRPKCPSCGWKADGRRIDEDDRRIENARAAAEAATPGMFEGRESK